MEKLSDEKALEYLDILFPYFPTNFQFVTNEIIFNSPIKEDAYDYGNKITFRAKRASNFSAFRLTR